MLIETIAFEIRNFENGEFAEYLVENTIANQDAIFAHRFTRNIRIAKTFAFQFEKEMAMPIEMISMDTWVRMINADPELFAYVAELAPAV